MSPGKVPKRLIISPRMSGNNHLLSCKEEEAPEWSLSFFVFLIYFYSHNQLFVVINKLFFDKNAFELFFSLGIVIIIGTETTWSG